jgi:hypothetical protein
VSSTYDYAIVRVVPRVERGEQINAGVVLMCATADFLGARVHLDEAKLRALAPDIDVGEVTQALRIVEWIAAGDPRGGPIAQLPRSERFHWLVAPRSAIIQPSVVHTGLCDDPQAALVKLLERLVK